MMNVWCVFIALIFSFSGYGQGEYDFHSEFIKVTEKAQQENKNILLVFTGNTCKNLVTTNEIINSKEFFNDIESQFLFLKLFVDDQNKLSADQEYMSLESDMLIKSEGHRNIDLQFSLTGNNSQPHYLVLNPKLKILKESNFMASKKEILQFLGLKETIID